MQSAWIKLVLIFLVTIQQTVAGVSCCCIASGAMAGGSEQAAITSSTKPACSKCKSKFASAKSTGKQSGSSPRLSTDTCNCKTSIDCVATQVSSVKFESSKTKKHAPVGADISDGSCQRDDLHARISLIASRLSRPLVIEPAPMTILSRLSLLSSWVI